MPGRKRLLFMLLLAIAAASCSSSDSPEGIRAGRSVYGDVCSVCHGPRGEGGVGPTLESVVETWPKCSDQVEWIRLGSERWRLEHGDTYGATEKALQGGMPSHEDQLTLDEMRLVAAFERAEYGGLGPEAALRQCGVAE